MDKFRMGYRDPESGQWVSLKPWMIPRHGETESDRLSRVFRTCYACGQEFDNVDLTNDHEEEVHE